MLPYPSKYPSQPTKSVSQKLNRNLSSLELENDLRCLRFTLRLPLVESDKTLPNGTKCIICKEPYDECFQIRGPEVGCQLPCKCIVGHLCAWRHFAPSQGAHVTCPVCHMRFSELANVNKGLFTPITDSSRQKHEQEAKKQLEQLENAASLHFANGHSSLEASLLNANNEAKNVEKKKASTESENFPCQVNSNAAKSAKQDLLRRNPSRRLSVARAAVKAVDLIAKRSG